MTALLAVTLAAGLTGTERAAVEELVAQAARTDGVPALNEAAMLHLRHPRPEIEHLLAHAGAELVGYAQRDNGQRDNGQRDNGPPGLTPAPATGHLVVAPEHRRSGVGGTLLAALLARSPQPLQMWAQGDPPAAAALARAYGLQPVRTLLVMTRSLEGELPAPRLPAEVTLRSFRPGQDEDAWLVVNARAFAGHPEQGSLTRADLDERMAQPWFDPGGFLLAERSGPPPGTAAGAGPHVAVSPNPTVSPSPTVSPNPTLVGFHWTKQHPGTLGEVYVLGVDPVAAGQGLGRALLRAGLAHLAAAGNRTVELYVEADHAAAVALYTGHGFAVHNRDVMYAQHTQES